MDKDSEYLMNKDSWHAFTLLMILILLSTGNSLKMFGNEKYAWFAGTKVITKKFTMVNIILIIAIDNLLHHHHRPLSLVSTCEKKYKLGLAMRIHLPMRIIRIFCI